MNRRSFLKGAAALGAAMALPITIAAAQTRKVVRRWTDGKFYWKDGVTGEWNNPDNWEGGVVPGNGCDVVIRSGLCRATDMPPITIRQLSLLGPGATFELLGEAKTCTATIGSVRGPDLREWWADDAGPFGAVLDRDYVSPDHWLTTTASRWA